MSAKKTADHTHVNADEDKIPLFFKVLYANNITAFILHYTLGAILAFLFAILFQSIFHLQGAAFRLMMVVLQIMFFVVSYMRKVDVDTYQGYILNFMGKKTYMILRNSSWPLFPFFSIEEGEDISYEIVEVEIEKMLVTDKADNTFWMLGIMPYHIKDEDAIKFTGSAISSFLRIMKAAAINAGSDVVNGNLFASKDSPLRNNARLNRRVLAAMNPEGLREKYGPTLDPPLLRLELTDETRNNFALKTKALNQALANRSLSSTQTELVIAYKAQLKAAGLHCSDEEAKNAVNAHINGISIYDFGPEGGGGIKVLNLETNKKEKN